MLMSYALKFNIGSFSLFYDYIEFDVCENRTLLLHQITDIFLNNTWYNMQTNVSANELTVRYIITFMPDEMQNELVHIMSSFDTNILVLSLTEPEIGLNSWRFNDIFLKSVKDSKFFWNDYINIIINCFKSDYFAVLQIDQNCKKRRINIKMLKESLTNKCFYFQGRRQRRGTCPTLLSNTYRHP